MECMISIKMVILFGQVCDIDCLHRNVLRGAIWLTAVESCSKIESCLKRAGVKYIYARVVNLLGLSKSQNIIYFFC